MRFLQQTNIDGGVYLLPAVQVSITEQEINWLLEGLRWFDFTRPIKAG